MPLGNPLPANAFRVLVADIAAPTVFVPLGLMNTFNVSEQEQVAEFDTFDSDDPITFAGKPRRTLSVNGFLGDADSGQIIALANARSKAKVILKFLWDGTNGFTQECRVNAFQGSGRAGNEPIALSLDFIATKAVGTIVASGPLL